MSSRVQRQSNGFDRATPPRRRAASKLVRDLVIIVVVAVVISTGIKTFLIRSF